MQWKRSTFVFYNKCGLLWLELKIENFIFLVGSGSRVGPGGGGQWFGRRRRPLSSEKVGSRDPRDGVGGRFLPRGFFAEQKTEG